MKSLIALSKLTVVAFVLFGARAELQAQTITLNGVNGSAASGEQIQYSGQVSGLTPNQNYTIVLTSYKMDNGNPAKPIPGTGDKQTYSITVDGNGNGNYSWTTKDFTGTIVKFFCPTNGTKAKIEYGVTAQLQDGMGNVIQNNGKNVQVSDDNNDLSPIQP